MMIESGKAIDIRMVRMDRDLAADEWNGLSRLLSEEKRQRLSRFRNREDACRSLLGELLVKATVSERTGRPISSISMRTNSFGKPLLNGSQPLHFNISHSGNWIVAIIADEEVGIDVEVIKPIDLIIAKRYFAKEEYSQLMAVPPQDRLAMFYTLWTLKESYVKAVGEGLSIPLNSFHFQLDDPASIRFEVLEGSYSQLVNPSSHRFRISRLADEAVLAVCYGSTGYLKEHACLGVDELLAEIGSLEGREA
ncbi:4'-phosphopantetheinyl transferase Sfp [Paenibacillus plantiphilus]|uniref:4'-phosphopantetheinyl transferase Sfp n=1 Tax=Paenibacillus plantiphilus TaxID=2905650 RepID=A0ABM9BMY2_9BACL|nr:4'-phosphopantetheinyl transferase superfamily protein [Paenibacillus plantiphilus]CAH1190142.1 4'-phosphopantetheinyl transferase Sfp [Paenibacillus plantiphilus]